MSDRVGRTDYYDDRDAPAASSIVPGASAVVADGQGRILLHRRRDNGRWALPGGVMDPGESIGAAAVREVLEETGLHVRPEYVIGVYSDPRHVFAYDDGEVRQEFSVCIACSLVRGRLTISDESTDLGWFTVAEIGALDMHPRTRVRIDDYLAGRRAVVD